jgi:hypothetical protein
MTGFYCYFHSSFFLEPEPEILVEFFFPYLLDLFNSRPERQETENESFKRKNIQFKGKEKIKESA